MLSKIIANPEILSVVAKELAKAGLQISTFSKEQHSEILTKALLQEPAESLMASFGVTSLTIENIRRLISRTDYMQVLLDNQGQLLGFGSLQNNPLVVQNHLELGRHILHGFTNQGYGQLLGLSLISFAHDHLERNVTSRINANNQASYRSHLHLIKYFPKNMVQISLKPNGHYYFIYSRP